MILQKTSIFLYPGYLTKGLKGKILWHPKYPIFDLKNNDWDAKESVGVTDCIHDPWPYVEGGIKCIISIESV
jgi:hypothetical protein